MLNKHKATKTLSNSPWRKDTKVLAGESLCLQFSGVALRAFVSLCLIVLWFFIVDFVELKLPPAPEASRRTNVIFSFGSYKKKLKRELCASRRNLSQQAGWTIALDAVCLYAIVLL